MPTPDEVLTAVAEVLADVEQIASTPEGKAALEAAVEFAASEGHEE